jgi:hypothetical protein
VAARPPQARLRLPGRVAELDARPGAGDARAAVPRPALRRVLAEGDRRRTSTRSAPLAWCPRCDAGRRVAAGVEERPHRRPLPRPVRLRVRRPAAPPSSPAGCPPRRRSTGRCPGSASATATSRSPTRPARASPPGSPATGGRSRSRPPATPSSAARRADLAGRRGPLMTLHTTMSKALAVPVEGRDGKVAQPTDAGARTQTTRHETGLVVPAGGTWNDDAGPTTDPLARVHHPRRRPRDGFILDRRGEYRPTSTTLRPSTRRPPPRKALLHQPFVAELRGGSSDARPVSDPLCTVTASGNHHALVAPYYSGSDHAQPATDPIGTLTTVDRYALIHRNNTGGDRDAHPRRRVRCAPHHQGPPVAHHARRHRRRRGPGRRLPVPDVRAARGRRRHGVPRPTTWHPARHQPPRPREAGRATPSPRRPRAT